MSMTRAVLVAGLCSASMSVAQSAPPPPLPATTDAPVTTPVTPTEKPYQLGARFGGSSGLGAWVPGMFSFHLFDVHGGVQVSPLFGAYLRLGYNASIGLGITAGPTGGSVTASAAGMWLVGANAELGLGDSFFLAGGPQVGIGNWVRARVAGSTSGGSVQTIISQGAHPGLDFKIGFGFGQPNKQTQRRTQFTLALDVAMLVATRVTDASASAGTEGVSVSVTAAEAIAIVPTLHLGFEWR